MTGVVVPVATVEDKSVPVVPKVNAATDVTVPPGLEELMVIDPAAFVMLTLVPAVKVVLVNPTPLPISKAPLAGVVVNPVPPLATATVPVTLAALPEMLPVTCDPGRLNTLRVVIVLLLVAVIFAAVPVVF